MSVRAPVQARLVWAAAALVVLYVLDDAFVHPQAGENLLSGLVVIAAVVAGALVIPRLRAGARGALEIIVGALAVLAGVADGIRPALTGGLSGDDLSAILAAVAGAVLVGAGLATIWRSRRLDERRGRRYARRALVGVVAMVAAAELVGPVAMSFLATHPVPDPVRAYIPSRNGAAVILMPGRRDYARMLARHGYGVLSLDRPDNLLGWGGDKDVLAAIAFLERRPEVHAIGGLGLSVGGELMLQTAAETPKLRAVVSEGAGERSLREHMHVPGAHRWLPVGGVAYWSVLTGATSVLGGEGPPPDLAGLVREVRAPVLLVYGENGQSGERALSPVYYAAARGPKALWEVPGAGHTGGLDAQPAAYERRVVAFLDKTLR